MGTPRLELFCIQITAFPFSLLANKGSWRVWLTQICMVPLTC